MADECDLEMDRANRDDVPANRHASQHGSRGSSSRNLGHKSRVANLSSPYDHLKRMIKVEFRHIQVDGDCGTALDLNLQALEAALLRIFINFMSKLLGLLHLIRAMKKYLHNQPCSTRD